MEVKYELVRLTKGFTLIEIDGEKPKDVIESMSELDIVRTNSNRKVIGTTEDVGDENLYKLNIKDCNHLFKIKEKTNGFRRIY